MTIFAHLRLPNAVIGRGVIGVAFALILGCPGGRISCVFAEERSESFDRDPGWDGHNNRSAVPETIEQDFGWSPDTAHAESGKGEIGGLITPAAEPAYYAKKLPPLTLNDEFAASGRIFVEKGAGNTLIGFFHSESINEWRTPNSIALRINQRGEIFHCHVEHCTGKWRAGAGVIGVHDKERDRMLPKELPAGQAYAWSLRYDPGGKGATGTVTATLDGETANYELPAGHHTDGLVIDRFGLLNVVKSRDSGGRIWLDDVTVNGRKEDFSRDPGWEASGNRRVYETLNVRPRFDFGFSPTQFVSGGATGEMGGLFFRGDCRDPSRLAAYGDRLEPLGLERPLRASGKVVLRRGVSDSTTLIGFYHSVHSLQVNDSQQFATPKDFLGIAIEGPSAEGFYFYPVYRSHGDGTANGARNSPPRIYPDGVSQEWSLIYDPAAGAGQGIMTVKLGGQTVVFALTPGDRSAGAKFDRFGLVTPWIDGNAQQVYFDDLIYTSRQDR